MHFWQQKTLAEMTPEEWESLCDGCGRCCLHKLEDEDTGEVFYTDIACRLLDRASCQCQDYPRRKQQVPECLVLTPEDVDQYHWLPETCAYRLLAAGQPLAPWHPLISGSPQSVHDAGIAVAGKVVSEREILPEDYEERIICWVN